METDSTDSKCVIGPENTLVCWRIHASLSPEMLQAGAAKGFMLCLAPAGAPAGEMFDDDV